MTIFSIFSDTELVISSLTNIALSTLTLIMIFNQNKDHHVNYSKFNFYHRNLWLAIISDNPNQNGLSVRI